MPANGVNGQQQLAGSLLGGQLALVEALTWTPQDPCCAASLFEGAARCPHCLQYVQYRRAVRMELSILFEHRGARRGRLCDKCRSESLNFNS